MYIGGTSAATINVVRKRLIIAWSLLSLALLVFLLFEITLDVPHRISMGSSEISIAHRALEISRFARDPNAIEPPPLTRPPSYHRSIAGIEYSSHAVLSLHGSSVFLSSTVSFDYTYSTLSIPLLYLLALAMIHPLFCLKALMRAQKRAWRLRNHLCPTCDYDIRATPVRCPECGSVFVAGKS